ncbi:hypothetical protein B0H10DRAFT_1950115 [Mycena sp. CBHHK59/15]|nr:hypothetical protein B0H10DRAFT_1950115 [Mycena sp. CBHHK59/15]
MTQLDSTQVDFAKSTWRLGVQVAATLIQTPKSAQTTSTHYHAPDRLQRNTYNVSMYLSGGTSSYSTVHYSRATSKPDPAQATLSWYQLVLNSPPQWQTLSTMAVLPNLCLQPLSYSGYAMAVSCFGSGYDLHYLAGPKQRDFGQHKTDAEIQIMEKEHRNNNVHRLLVLYSAALSSCTEDGRDGRIRMCGGGEWRMWIDAGGRKGREEVDDEHGLGVDLHLTMNGGEIWVLGTCRMDTGDVWMCASARWQTGYNWKKHKVVLNAELPQFMRDIEEDGHRALNLHNVHKKNSVAGVILLLFVHGCPFSEGVQPKGIFNLSLEALTPIGQSLKEVIGAIQSPVNLQPYIVGRLLTWIYEKLVNWSESSQPMHIRGRMTKARPTASLRIYSKVDITTAFLPPDSRSDIPLGHSFFPKDIIPLLKSWTHCMSNIMFNEEHDAGGTSPQQKA